MYDYPPEKDFPNFRKTFGPRGVMRSYATDKDDPTVEPRWGKVGKQKIEDTGPLNKKRMETCDDEFVEAAADFIKRQNKDGKPFFVWLNTTHMHFITHTKPKSLGQAGRWQSPYHDTMIDHDKNVGQMLDLLDELGIAEDTFVRSDDEFVEAAADFIKRQNKDGKPFFVWLNTTHMHFITHTKPKSLGQAGRWQSPYHDTMIDHDKNVGQMLDLLDELGIAEDTFV